jgi:DNA-directed RNA polymerase specialized sigma24 family protein
LNIHNRREGLGASQATFVYMSLFSFKPASPDENARRREDKSRENLFLEHYSWLRECALNITHGQRERAEDLVHDVFLQFLDKDADITSIADVRGYLNGILRNLHLLQLRRAMRHPAQPLSLFDHDSALVGLRVWTSAERLQSADLLVRACDFACHRKEAALTASILILRFFHGYYPGEIALLLRARRRAVDQWVERGRIETKRYIESAYPIPDTDRSARKMSSVASANALLRHLRERIFNSCTTDCSILGNDQEKLGVKELAHLVSCQACLERRSVKIGLAHVAERMADDISDRDDGRPQGGIASSGEILPFRGGRRSSRRAILRQMQARRRERFEHRPKELSLAFDGQPRATLVVNAPTNTLHLSLDSKEVPNSIAVLSEQDFHFLILDHNDLSCSERRVYRLRLSDDRFLEVTVTPETLGPSIQVVYEDPLLLLAGRSEDQEPLTITAEQPILSFPSGRTESAPAVGFAWPMAWVGKLLSLVPAMNATVTGAMVVGVAALLCFMLWPQSRVSLSAAELLEHAQKADHAATTANRPGVIYQKVAIRTRRRTLERTIYRDAQGIRHPRRQRLSAEEEQLKDKLARAGVSWDAPLSALDYAEWRHRSGPAQDAVKRTGEHLLTLTTTPLADNDVLKETFTVRDTDFHGVDRTVELRDSGTVAIAQLNYDVLPWGAVNQDWFETVPRGAATDAPGVLSPDPSHLSSELELETELAVRYALHQAGADLGDPIDVHTSTQGSAAVAVVGIVPSRERKQELLAALSGIPHVNAQLRTEDEAARSMTALPPVTRAETLVVTSHSPIEKQLQEYLGDPMAVESFSKRAIGLSKGLMAHAWALRHLSERYGVVGSPSDLGLSPTSRQLLQIMRRDHQRGMSEATAELTTLLRPVLHSIVQASPESFARLPLFDSAEQARRFTIQLLSGSASPGANESSDPAKAAENLLAALRGLQIALEEQR